MTADVRQAPSASGWTRTAKFTPANPEGETKMISYHIHAALAAERSEALRAEAEAYRRAEQARPHRRRRPGPRYPARGKRAVLRDGSACHHGREAPGAVDRSGGRGVAVSS
jgi:hypothetical protein